MNDNWSLTPEEKLAIIHCFKGAHRGAYNQINKKIAKEIGIINALLLDELIFFCERNESYLNGNNGWFPLTREEIQESCNLSHWQQRESIKYLIAEGYLEKDLKGIPARNYFRLNFTKIDKTMTDNNESLFSNVETTLLDTKTTQNQIENGSDRQIPNINSDNSESVQMRGNYAPSNVETTLLSNNISNSTPEVKPLSILDKDYTSGIEVETAPRSTLPILLRNRPVEVPRTNKLRRPKPKPSPLQIEVSNGIRELFIKKAKVERAKRKQTAMTIIPTPIRELMDFWERLGFKIPNPDKAPNSYNNIVRSMKKLMDGKLIPEEKRKFTYDEIEQAMTNFSLFVFDDGYGPENKSIKETLKKKSLDQFLYSPFCGKSNIVSWFIKMHDEPLSERKAPETEIVDKHPEVTNRLKDFFYKYVLAGIKKKLTIREENKFKEGSNRICEIYDHFRHRFVGINGYIEMSDIFCQSLQNVYGEKVTKVVPGSFASSFSMSRMIAYMNEKGYIPDAGFQIGY